MFLYFNNKLVPTVKGLLTLMIIILALRHSLTTLHFPFCGDEQKIQGY